MPRPLQPPFESGSVVPAVMQRKSRGSGGVSCEVHHFRFMAWAPRGYLAYPEAGRSRQLARLIHRGHLRGIRLPRMGGSGSNVSWRISESEIRLFLKRNMT